MIGILVFISAIATPTALAALGPVIYLSTDVEADGRIPGPSSMLSFATVAFDADKKIVGEFSANLKTMRGARPEPKIMAWWALPENAPAYAASRLNQEAPGRAMKRYLKWIKTLPGDPVFLAYPATFDFMFVYWYLIRFANASPFAHRGLDMRSFAMGFMGTSFSETRKEAFPKEWFDPLPHTHLALDDAREQGALFMNMLRARRRCTLSLEVAAPP